MVRSQGRNGAFTNLMARHAFRDVSVHSTRLCPNNYNGSGTDMSCSVVVLGRTSTGGLSDIREFIKLQ
jgi:hypothetical protein